MAKDIVLSLSQLKEIVHEEFKRVLKEWESGKLYYRTKAFIKDFTKEAWMNKLKHDRICML